jgi:hypothetical protein
MSCARILASCVLVLSFVARSQCAAVDEPVQLLQPRADTFAAESTFGRKLSNVVVHHKGRHTDLDYLEMMTLLVQREESPTPIQTPGPEWRFVPEFVGAAFPGKPELRWTAPCFATDSLAVDFLSGNSLRVILDTSQRQEALGCGDAYLIATVTDFHLLEPHVGGAYVVEWQGLESVRSVPPHAPHRDAAATRRSANCAA